MIESIFQTFLLLAYSDIALLALAVANYAVSASYLGRETRLSRKRMETKRQELLQKLIELQKKDPEIAEIKKEIKGSEADERRLSTRLFLLSWLGAVVLPSMFFVISFACAVLGLNSEILPYDPQFLQQQMMIFSLGTISIGVLVLLFVVRTIDSAAKRIPVPKFDVSFQSGLRNMKLGPKEKTTVTFCVANRGEDVAENVSVFVCFPPEFAVMESSQGLYRTYKQSSLSPTPNYNAAISKAEVVHIGTILEIDIDLLMPEKQGIYEIPVNVYERKIGLSSHKLVIDVS
jgi:hypothetical protein